MLGIEAIQRFLSFAFILVMGFHIATAADLEVRLADLVGDR
mgnify:FL=1|jgi:hypothetical protein